MDMRDRILHIVRTYPGLHLREVARQADTSLNLVQYYVQRLQDDGLLELMLQDNKVRLFPPDLRREDRLVLGTIRDKRRIRIVMTLLDQGTAAHAHLARSCKMGKSTLSFHLAALVDAGVATKDTDGYGITDTKRVRALIDRYPPTADAADRLAHLWESVYGSRR